MEPISPPLIGKKVCNMLKIAMLMLQKGVSKSKILGGKAFNDLNIMFHDHHAMLSSSLSCKSLDLDVSFASPSPLSCKSLNVDTSFVSPSTLTCMSHDMHVSFETPSSLTCKSRDAHLSYFSPLEYEFSCSGSPPRRSYSTKHLRANRISPSDYHMRRNHRKCTRRVPSTTRRYERNLGLIRSDVDSPFGVRDSTDDDVANDVEYCRVDWEAERFIESFYRELRLQKWIATFEAEYQ